MSQQALLETIFNKIVLNPTRLWPKILMPEIASLCQNLSGIDSIETLSHLIDIKLPTVIFQLIAITYPESISTTSYCQDALCNLVEAFQEMQLYLKV